MTAPVRDATAVLEGLRTQVEAELARLLPDGDGPAATVHRAMRYAAVPGGKRLRPLTVLAACRACGGRVEDALPAAAALEMIHAYSLVHDDLPSMDDDDLRRGRPTVHRAFGEAEAVLAGDALLTLAFEVLGGLPAGAEHAAHRAEVVVVVARAAGAAGMVGGQQADLEAERAPLDATRLEWIHRHKTGALLGAAAEVGAIHAGAEGERRAALARFGRALGLAFQIADDVLDATSTAEALGKTPGKDARSGKATYPALFGLPAARDLAEQGAQEALAELRAAGLRDDPLLVALARGAVRRSA